MELGIFAKTFAGTDPETVLGGARAAGYRTVQYNLACSGLPSMPDFLPEGAAEAVGQAAAETGVSIAALSGTYNMVHPDPALRAEGLARLEIVAAAARGMGTGLVTLCTGTRDTDDQWRHHPDNDTPAAWADLLAEMEKAVLIAERHDLLLGIEPEGANVVDGAKKARRLIAEIGSDRLAIVIDAANLVEAGDPALWRQTIAEAVDLLADRIVMAHAKDRRADGSFAAPGAGAIDFVHYLGALQKAGFSGPLVTHGLMAAEAGPVAGFLGSALERVAR
ncbi:sugar phosphate isomerase/epimerase [Arsenicitalea aurantiaca]|uniref:Sugar phosphate isomerase/epimerase n=1 Tax=Arsenicitalea aurantiaca TaxID=1783274 RepID=A0A433XBA2_9HYPH|nr:sugar phosphate isomerase/epimerase [Arsenicitalea aurantiaca]RUT31359.1 sugar phosphate isomerase/epimerase [Arsenicitalea aurantiaca]